MLTDVEKYLPVDSYVANTGIFSPELFIFSGVTWMITISQTSTVKMEWSINRNISKFNSGLCYWRFYHFFFCHRRLILSTTYHDMQSTKITVGFQKWTVVSIWNNCIQTLSVQKLHLVGWEKRVNNLWEEEIMSYRWYCVSEYRQTTSIRNINGTGTI